MVSVSNVVLGASWGVWCTKLSQTMDGSVYGLYALFSLMSLIPGNSEGRVEKTGGRETCSMACLTQAYGQLGEHVFRLQTPESRAAAEGTFKSGEEGSGACGFSAEGAKVDTATCYLPQAACCHLPTREKNSVITPIRSARPSP